MTDTSTPLPDMSEAPEPAEAPVRVSLLVDPTVARIVAGYPDAVLRLPTVLDLGSGVLTITELDAEVHKPGPLDDGLRYCEACHYVWPCKDAPASSPLPEETGPGE